jgi:AsmA protein
MKNTLKWNPGRTMNQNTLKKLLFAVCGIVLLLVVGWIALGKLLDPNLYRDQIILAVKKATGRDLRINGKMSWSLFPLGFKVRDAELGNLPGFGSEPFASLKEAEIEVQLGQILKKKLVVDAIQVDGLTLNLTRNASGSKNWEKVESKAAPVQRATKPIESQTKKRSKADPEVLTDLHLGKVSIRNANIYWKDLKSQQTYSLQNLTLTTSTITGADQFDMNLNFDLNYGEPLQHSKVQLKSTYLPLPDGFKLSDFELMMDQSRMTGNAELRRKPAPVWKFDFKVNELDVDRYLTKSKDKPSDAESSQSPLIVLAGMNGTGTIEIGKLKLLGIRLSDLSIQTTIADGIFHLGPNKAKLYGGTYSGQSMVDASSQRVGLQLNEQLRSVDAGQLFRDMHVLEKFSGNGSIQINLNTHGVQSSDFENTLTGTVRIALSNGKIQGVNLEKMIRETKELSARIKGKPVVAETSPTDQTLFSTMTASVRFTNGIGKTEDIKMEGKVLDATGGGTINLMRESLNLKLSVKVTEPGKTKATTIPILVQGGFKNPKFQVDWGSIVESAIERNLDRQIDKALKKLFKKDKNR